MFIISLKGGYQMSSNETNAAGTVINDNAVERQLEQQKKRYLSPKEFAAYIVSGFGDKNWETFNGSNSFFFNTTFLNADPVVLSLSSSVCAIADTFDNAISGPIIDRTRTRWGRVRPYLILTLPIWLFSALSPWLLPGGMSQTAIFIWFLVISYIGSIAGSFYNPCYTALLYNLTPNINERHKLIATDTYIDLLGVWLPSLFPFLVDYLPRDIPTRIIYMGGAFFFIAGVVVFRSIGFFTLKERMPLASRDEMNSVSIWKSVKQVATCRPMWVLVIKNFFGFGKGVGNSVANYFWLNCTGKISNGSIIGLFTGLPSYFVLPFAPKLTKKMGLKNLASFSYAFCGITYIIMYLIGYKPFGNGLMNMVYLTIMLTIAGALNSIQRYCSTALQGDVYDYVEWKTGIRNEGMITAAMGYITLITNNIANILSGVIIKSIHYVPLLNAYGVVIPQTDQKMLAGIWTIFALAPGIGRLAKAITLQFFNVHGKTKDRMMVELAEIRAAKVVDTGEADGNQGLEE